MGLEAVTYIDDLNVDWPLSTDKRRQGDDHLRNIKLAIKNTFPNLTEPMTKTAAALNQLPANLEDLYLHLLPKGAIIGWDLANEAIPSGFNLCDGSTVVGYGTVPDMRNRFIVCAGSDYTNGATGGADSKSSGAAGAHSHTGATASHTLTTAEIPSHTHSLSEQVFVDEADVGTGVSYIVSGSGRSTGAAGGGGGHTHNITAEVDHTHTVDVRPRYYAAVFIVKTGEFTPE